MLDDFDDFDGKTCDGEPFEVNMPDPYDSDVWVSEADDDQAALDEFEAEYGFAGCV